MSKMAVIRQYQYSPAAGGIFSSIAKFVGKGLGLIKTAAPAVATVVKSPIGKTAIAAGVGTAAGALLSGAGSAKGPGGASGAWAGGRRRSRGITARELRGYRKVANLIHKEGMVSKRARGRH